MNDDNDVGDGVVDSPPTAENETAASTTAGAGGCETEFLPDAVRNVPTPVAWESEPDDDVDGGRRPWVWAVGIAAIAVSIGLATALGIYVIGHTHPNAAPAPALPQHVLDGIYRLDFDVANQTVMGSPNNPADQKPPTTAWRAFRSTCAHGCTATEVALDNTNHQSVDAAGPTNQWRWVGDHWQSQVKRSRVNTIEPNDNHPAELTCSDTDDKTGIGQDTHAFTTSLEPQPDGTLKGVATDTTVSNDCNRIGLVGQVPVLATRVGDLTPNMPVPDPRDVATPGPPPAPTPGPALNGIYRLNFDGSQDRATVNGVRDREAETGKDDNETWVFRSLCTPTGCVAIGAKVDAANTGETQGAMGVFRFAENRWQGSQKTILMSDFRRCGVTGKGEAVDGRDFQPHPDGTITGTHTTTVTDDLCGHGETIYTRPFTATQLAATVPSTVVLADPALFAT
jgi:serine/threonine protein kinase, bacterial